MHVSWVFLLVAIIRLDSRPPYADFETGIGGDVVSLVVGFQVIPEKPLGNGEER